ncbi:MAG: tight adherence protein [Frankiaceae bacterium]|jgi:tight adherence protein B|nr:tight adherence protein [Frankiaceae bacterium]
MGAFLGLLLGTGLFLVHRACTTPRRPGNRWRATLSEQLAQAGMAGVRPGRLLGASAALGVVTFVLVAGVSRVAVIGAAFGAFAASVPVNVVRSRRRKRAAELREVWPEVVDNLASAIRAGLSLPEAVAQLATRGPEPLRPAFARFAADHRATGRFGDCLDRLKAGLADPVGDRVVESLRMAREVGGTDLGRLLRTLSAFLREDARTRAELETRQGWTVSGARLALAAPWLLLLLLSTRPGAVEAYSSATGALVLLGGGGVSLLAYRLMLRIARLPEERRVLR